MFNSSFITYSRVPRPLNDHERGGNPENILRQILGDVQ